MSRLFRPRRTRWQLLIEALQHRFVRWAVPRVFGLSPSMAGRIARRSYWDKREQQMQNIPKLYLGSLFKNLDHRPEPEDLEAMDIDEVLAWHSVRVCNMILLKNFVEEYRSQVMYRFDLENSTEHFSHDAQVILQHFLEVNWDRRNEFLFPRTISLADDWLEDRIIKRYLKKRKGGAKLLIASDLAPHEIKILEYVGDCSKLPTEFIHRPALLSHINLEDIPSSPPSSSATTSTTTSHPVVPSSGSSSPTSPDTTAEAPRSSSGGRFSRLNTPKNKFLLGLFILNNLFLIYFVMKRIAKDKAAAELRMAIEQGYIDPADRPTNSEEGQGTLSFSSIRDSAVAYSKEEDFTRSNTKFMEERELRRHQVEDRLKGLSYLNPVHASSGGGGSQNPKIAIPQTTPAHAVQGSEQ